MSDAPPLRLLLVEDSATDAKLILRELRREERQVDFERVQDEAGLRAALGQGTFDAVISDWSMPGFSALEALRIVHGVDPDLPFIVVSGTISEDTAVEAMRAGASDYVLKDRLLRLRPAIEREMRDREVRRARRAAEEEVRRQERRFRAMINRSHEMISLIGPDKTTLFVSDSIRHILGYEPEELVGRPAGLRAHPEDRERALKALAQVISGAVRTGATEARVFHKDGSLRWFDITITNLFDDPQIGAVVGNYRDITERKRAEAALRESEEQLRQAQKMESIGRLAGGIAHDFNNLLSVILGYSDLVLGGLAEADPMRAELGEIHAAAERASALTRQLLAFSRKQVLQPRAVDLHEVVTGMEKLLRRLIGEDVELSTHRTSEACRVYVDPGQLEQVIMNLVVNARDAMPRGGRLTITTGREDLAAGSSALRPDMKPGPHVTLTVTDTGEGMSEATVARIFEPFFTTKPAGKGTGLGLATVFGIVQQSGGSVGVETALGKGTTFRIHLPVSSGPEVAPRAGVRRDLTGKETVLLVEDDPSLRALARTILRRRGYTVLDAGGAADALRIGEQHSGPLDLVVTDVVMPGMSGRELAEQLAKLRPGIRVLFMSGYTDDAIMRHGVASGLAILQKPLTPDQLAAKVREVLDAP